MRSIVFGVRFASSPEGLFSQRKFNYSNVGAVEVNRETLLVIFDKASLQARSPEIKGVMR